MKNSRIVRLLAVCAAAAASLHVMPSMAAGAGGAPGKVTRVTDADPHYTDRGFFDVHVCNWPNRPLFFLSLFSTTEFRQFEKVTITMPDGRELGQIVPADFKRIIKRKDKPEKRVYMAQMDIPSRSQNGWYTAVARFTDGGSVTAHDYVVIESMHQPANMQPAAGQKEVALPATLSWDPVPGASHYKVFISDGWDGSEVYTSQMLEQPRLEVPPGALEEGGWYRWFVHARDVNENILLGDFNHGSLSVKQEFFTSGY